MDNRFVFTHKPPPTQPEYLVRLPLHRGESITVFLGLCAFFCCTLGCSSGRDPINLVVALFHGYTTCSPAAACLSSFAESRLGESG